jgi:glycosyltransferase involved in cell wall biosynthesis
MKLAMLLPGGVDRGGVDRVIPSRLWLIERLAVRHEVHVFAMRQEAEPDSWDLLGARVHNIGTARGSTRRLMARFHQLHRQSAEPFDVVHAFFGWCGTAAAAIGWRYRVPVLFHPSGGEFVTMPEVGYGMQTTLTGRIGARVALMGAHRLTVASESMRALAREKHRGSVECVPIGVALDRWPRRVPRSRELTRPIRLLHVGDIRPVKDQTTLMGAARRLADAGIEFTLDMVGYDTMHGRLQQSPDAERVASRTRWHGVLRRDALRSVMDEADILVVSSLHEAGPLVVLEAAVAGVPTVGTNVGHIAEWAPDAAVAVPVGSAGTLAAAIALLAADEPRRLRLAHEAQRRACAVDADYTARTFEKIYDEMVMAR